MGQIGIGGSLAGGNACIAPEVWHRRTHSNVERRYSDGKTTITGITGNDRKSHQPRTRFKR